MVSCESINPRGLLEKQPYFFSRKAQIVRADFGQTALSAQIRQVQSGLAAAGNDYVQVTGKIFKNKPAL